MFWIAILTISVLGAVLPGMGTELYMTGAAVLLGPVQLAALLVLSAAGQAAGKLLVYHAAGAGAGLARSGRRLSERWRERIGRSPAAATAVVFTSSLGSLPPLYLTAIACGAAGLGSARFTIVVFVGRILRYALLVAITRLTLERLP